MSFSQEAAEDYMREGAEQDWQEEHIREEIQEKNHKAAEELNAKRAPSAESLVEQA